MTSGNIDILSYRKQYIFTKPGIFILLRCKGHFGKSY